MTAFNDGIGIGDNALARELKLRGTPVPQSTITRIANGTTKDPKEAQLRPLAAFFGVTTSVLRGEAPIKSPTGPPRAGEPRPAAVALPQDLTPEAIHLARTWMQLSPARRAHYHEEMVWMSVFERKFPYFRIGRPSAESYDNLEHSIEENWEKMVRQAKLPLE